MPRSTAFLAGEIRAQIDEARELIFAAEGAGNFLYARRWYVYEAAYLLAFSAWENLLEQTFYRFLCGYQNSSGLPLRNGTWTRPRDVAAAEALVLNGRQYVLWHNPAFVIGRSQGYFNGAPHETVLQSALHDFEDFAAIRHYVAHRTEDTKRKFQLAATRLSGAPTIGARAGRLPRSKTIDPVSGAQVTWFERIVADLNRYAAQIVN